MDGYDLILTLTGGLSAALVLGYVTQRLGLSPIVGYLLAGTLVGPHTPGFVADGKLAEELAEIIGALAVVLLGKPLMALAIVWAMRYPLKVALTVAVALAQIGEFSFILSTIGRELGIFTIAATNTLVAASMVSIVLNPLLYRAVGPTERWLAASPRLWKLMNRAASQHVDQATPVSARAGDAVHRAVVVGYGPTGRTVVRLLRENQIEPTVVELNMDSVRQLQSEGIDAVYGDATRPKSWQRRMWPPLAA